MQEERQLIYDGKAYRCVISYKPMRNIRFHFDKSGTVFCVSAPSRIPQKTLADAINNYFPRLLKRLQYEPPFTGDEVYLFGVKETVNGFGNLSEKDRNAFLKKKLADFLEPTVRYYEATMGVKKPYRVRVRSMSSRYGVNSQKTHTLTFTTALVHYAPKTITSVVVHELAHDFVFNHSSRFYAIVYRYCPDYDECHKALRKHHYE